MNKRNLPPRPPRQINPNMQSLGINLQRAQEELAIKKCEGIAPEVIKLLIKHQCTFKEMCIIIDMVKKIQNDNLMEVPVIESK